MVNAISMSPREKRRPRFWLTLSRESTYQFPQCFSYILFKLSRENLKFGYHSFFVAAITTFLRSQHISSPCSTYPLQVDMGEFDFLITTIFKMIVFFISMPFLLKSSRQEVQRKGKITIPQKLTRNVVVKIYNDRSCFPVS